MHISLIGMSNVGKSLWSKRLEQIGFLRFCIDDLIEEQLEQLLRDKGFNGIADVALWMGHPYEPQYQQNSKIYLDIERSVMHEVLKTISRPEMAERDIVVDTTGSVIYTGADIIKTLKQHTLVCYIETTPEIQDEMYQQFLADPKPIIWGTVFQMQDGELPSDALSRCYIDLLKQRTQEYHRHKNITIDIHTIRQPDYTADAFLNEIKDHASKPLS